MSGENARDPRVALVREKYFSLRPKPLEKWLWAAKAPGSAERVFWYHWDVGHQNGSWLSQVPIRIVAKECGLDVGTVTRAYQWLTARGLIRRVDPGRDEANPFRQATALTEVYVPRDLVQRLAAEPNRRQRARAAEPPVDRSVAPTPIAAQPLEAGTATAKPAALARRESQQIFQKLSETERQRFYVEQRDRGVGMVFDEGTRLTDAEQGHVRATLASLAAAKPTAVPVATSGRIGAQPAARARLTVLQLAALRARIVKSKGEGDPRDVNELVRQVAWSVEEGALARFEPALALSIACKKIREQAWSTPRGMPVAWRAPCARPETCSAAGRN